MLDSNDLATIRAVRLLFDEVARGPAAKPLVLWVGAGCSSWCGYPRWGELAEGLHSAFARYEPEYNRNLGLELLKAERFPEVFQTCRDTSSRRFYELLSAELFSREPTPVYHRFAVALRAIEPIQIVTTNVDELLEKCLPAATTVGRRDLERAVHLLHTGVPFVCKIHGSVSDLRSTVFAQQDYMSLSNDTTFRTLLARLLSVSSMIFIGYSLQDDYLLTMLQEKQELAVLFGDGPHFAILPHGQTALPPSVRIIRYVPEPHKDHRSSISVIEELVYLRGQEGAIQSVDRAAQGPPRAACSTHLLSHFLPPGTWRTSETVEIQGEDGLKKQVIIGTGFTNEELSTYRSTAIHDLIVGLLCFDQVLVPVQAIGSTHRLLGSERFWALVQDNALSFISCDNQECIVFPDAKAVASGDLGSFSTANPDRTERTIGQLVRQQIQAAPGKASVAEQLFSDLERKIHKIAASEEDSIPAIVRGLLLRPTIRALLGVSGGTPLHSIARWQVYPTLRLAGAVRIGAICRLLQIRSAKLDFGFAKLAGPAFAASTGTEWTDDAASYVLCGRFAADLGELVVRNPSILDAVRGLRDSSAGESLRREVASRLAASEGAEATVAINSALMAGIPSGVLQRARDHFVGLFVATAGGGQAQPALWNDRRAEDAIAGWRRVSRKLLYNHCYQARVGAYDPCPCGSGEQLRFCCDEALRS